MVGDAGHGVRPGAGSGGACGPRISVLAPAPLPAGAGLTAMPPQPCPRSRAPGWCVARATRLSSGAEGKERAAHGSVLCVLMVARLGKNAGVFPIGKEASRCRITFQMPSGCRWQVSEETGHSSAHGWWRRMQERAGMVVGADGGSAGVLLQQCVLSLRNVNGLG